MFSWLVLIVLLAALVVLGTWLWGQLLGRGEPLPPMADNDTVMADNRRLLAAGNSADVRFELVPRGYRPEQVDDVIEAMSARIKELEESSETPDDSLLDAPPARTDSPEIG